MRRLVIFGSLLLMVHVLLIGASTLFGSQQPFAPAITTNHLTDCALPCWAGIQIGTTDQLGGTTFLQNNLPDYEIIDQRPGLSLLVGADNSISSLEILLGKREFPDQQLKVSFGFYYVNGAYDATIHEIALTAFNTSRLPSILDLAALYGQPICVVQNPGISNTPLIVMFQPSDDPDAHVTARLMNRGKGWRSPVYEIKLVTSFPNNCKDWRGFTNLTQHLRTTRR